MKIGYLLGVGFHSISGKVIDDKADQFLVYFLVAFDLYSEDYLL